MFDLKPLPVKGFRSPMSIFLHSDKEPRFVSGFKQILPNGDVHFITLKDVFPNSEFPTCLEYYDVLREIIRLATGNAIPNETEAIQRIKDEETQYEELLKVYKKAGRILRNKSREAAQKYLRKKGIPQDIYDNLSNDFLAFQIEQTQQIIDLCTKRLFYLDLSVQDRNRLTHFGNLFLHSEQAAYFYFVKYFEDPANIEAFCSIFNSSLEGKFVDIFTAICTKLNMCKNCAKTHSIASQHILHHLKRISDLLKSKGLKKDPRLITWASCLESWPDDPLPALTTNEWNPPFVAHLSPQPI